MAVLRLLFRALMRQPVTPAVFISAMFEADFQSVVSQAADYTFTDVANSAGVEDMNHVPWGVHGLITITTGGWIYILLMEKTRLVMWITTDLFLRE